MEKKNKDIKKQVDMVSDNEALYQIKTSESQDKVIRDELKTCYTLEESKTLIIKTVQEHFHTS